jgi:hypothetical protein
VKLLFVIAVITLTGCGSEPQRILTPKAFAATLSADPSTATPDRLCNIIGSDARPIELKIRGHVPRNESDEAGKWQIVEPAVWSASAVSSQFDMGLGGVSSHRWKTQAGDMSASVSWCDECPRDGTDSSIEVYDATFRFFAGVCRPIEPQGQPTDTVS